MATRSRHTDAVSSLKAPSQDPQSESIADLVSVEVVSGPGVSSIGSVMESSSRFENLPGQRISLRVAEDLHGFEHAFLVAQPRVFDASERRHFQAVARYFAHVYAAHLQLLDKAGDQVDSVGAKR